MSTIDINNNAQTEVWAKELDSMGILKGKEAGYALEQPLTRAECAALLVQLLGDEKRAIANDSPRVFYDVGPTHWAYPYARYCAPYIMATEGNLFYPDQGLTGAEFLEALLRAFYIDNTTLENAYEQALLCKIIAPDNVAKLQASSGITRGQAVAIIYPLARLPREEN